MNQGEHLEVGLEDAIDQADIDTDEANSWVEDIDLNRPQQILSYDLIGCHGGLIDLRLGH